MRDSFSFKTTRTPGTRTDARVWLTAVAALAWFAVPSARAGDLANGGFDAVGPAGNPVTTLAQSAGWSAALGWQQYALVPGSSITSELLPTTDPSGSGNMIHFITDNGDWPPSHAGNGFWQSFSTVPAASLSFDLEVVSGQVTAGLVLVDGAYVDYPTFGPTSGWIHVTDVSSQPVSFVAFESLSLGVGAEYYVDNLVMTSVPEPSTMVLLGTASLAGILGLLKLRRRRRAAN
jgi:hypothetical protein